MHRDLKPSNVVLSRGTDGRPLARLLDFGISRAFDAPDQSITRTGLVVEGGNENESVAKQPVRFDSVRQAYTVEQPARSDIDALTGAAVLDFGTNWCGYCKVAKPLVEAVLAGHPRVKHLKVEDGPGRPLGRSFGVKLWPTLVFLRDGREVTRLVRPSSEVSLGEALGRIDS